MRYNQLAHPNESSLGCVLCVPNAIFDEVTPVRNAGCPLCLLNFHAKGVPSPVQLRWLPPSHVPHRERSERG